MRQNLFIAAMSLLVMAGCTEGNDELDNVQPKDNAIRFTTYVGQQTKATAVDNFANGDEFAVYAHHFTTEDASGGFMDNFMKGTVIKKDGATWGYKVPADQKYWPKNGKVNFVALYPIPAEADVTVSDNTAGVIAVKYNVLTSNIKEFMWAVQTNATSETGEGTISFPFNHALSKIIFQAKTDKDVAAIATIKISKIEFKNSMPSEGTYTIPAALTVGSWESTTPSAFSVTPTAQDVNANGTDVSSLGDLLLIPQTVTNQVITITYEITYTTTGQVDAGTQDFDLLTPLTWEQNKQYTYTFKISLGSEIKMEASDPTGWGANTDQDLPLNPQE